MAKEKRIVHARRFRGEWRLSARRVPLLQNRALLGSLYYCDVTTSKELDELRREDPSLRRRVEDLLAAQLGRAVAIVENRKAEVERLANAVAQRSLLSRREVAELFATLKRAG
ncbi:hypothetical protein [Pseudaminobacter soli (ex Li et al. 2025)]|uniref:hypothetical protein n=1 Tax=Pseudaminobacter soli (ex Li et al. 2025) TaxID=1295366 RepID=UPI000D0E749B|nr:hypothetical protein [Mesorhizobium soli]